MAAEMIGDNWVERLAARDYYGRHATGSVVIVNYHCAFHGTPAEATAFLKRMRARAQRHDQDNTKLDNTNAFL